MKKQTAAHIRFIAIIVLGVAVLIFLFLQLTGTGKPVTDAEITDFIISQTARGEEIRRFSFVFNDSQQLWEERYASDYIPLNSANTWNAVADAEDMVQQSHVLNVEMWKRLQGALEENGARHWESDYFAAGDALEDQIFCLTIRFADGSTRDCDCINAFPEGMDNICAVIYDMIGLIIIPD